MKCFLVLRDLTQKERKYIANSLNARVYTSDASFTGNIPHELIRQDERKKKEINYKAFFAVINFYGTYLKGNKTLAEIEMSGFHFWFYHKFRIYFAVRNCLYEIDMVRSLPVEDANLEVFGSNLQAKQLLGRSMINYHLPNNTGRSVTQLFNFAAITALRFFAGLFTTIKLDNRILILDNKENYARIRTREDGIGFRNVQIEYLLSVADKSHTVLLDKFTPPASGQEFSLNFSYLKKHYSISRICEEEILYTIRNWGKRKEAKLLSRKITQAISAIEGNDETDNLILDALKELYGSTSYFCWKFLCYKYFFSKRKPKVILITDEYSANTRLIMEGARVNRIPVVSFQHGSMHDLHPGYVYSAEDPVDEITPDGIIVWGDRWKDFLINHGYPAERIKTGGQLRTDIIPVISTTRKSAAEILRENIGGKDIVLFASQPQRDLSLRYKTAFEIFKAAAQLSEFILVVKLHPVENDFSYYNQIAKRANCDNYIITKEADLYELISVSRAVITSFSTVGTEAVYFRKPVLIFDPLKQDVLGLVREGVAVQCLDSNDIHSVLLKVMKGEFQSDEDKISAFIKSQVFAIDGKTGQRYLDILTSIPSLS